MAAATNIIKGKLEQLQNVTLHMAVTGMAGAGKSTFVNANANSRRMTSSSSSLPRDSRKMMSCWPKKKKLY